MRFAAIIILAAALVPAVASAQIKTAVVDVHRAMTSTKHWKTAVAALEKERVSKQAVLETKQAELRKRKEKLDAQKVVSDPKAILGEEEKLFQDAQMLTQAFLQTQQQLTAREKRLTDQMLSRIERIVQQMAIEKEYMIIFETGTEATPNVLYSKKSIDLTNKVIARYKKNFKDKPLKTE